MAPLSLLMKGVGLSLLLASLASSSPWHLRNTDYDHAILGRQDDPTESLSCEPSCDINTCGGGICGIGITRRSFDDLGSLFDRFDSMNVSDAHGIAPRELRELSKRIWRFDPASKDPVGDRDPEVHEVDTYLPAVFNGMENAYFKGPSWLFAGDERAVSQQIQFGDKPFQIMTGGIHGCHTIALISNRAVWMAHFWESYSNGKPNQDTPATSPDFVDRVLKFIRGEAVTNPAPSTYKPYMLPMGPSPDPELFNRDDDETQLLISTPIATGASLEHKNPKLKYPTRVTAIESEFRRRIGKKPLCIRIPYQRLDYSIPEEEALENKSNRGMYLFQYDPNSDGKGKKAWRVFFEARYKVKNLP